MPATAKTARSQRTRGALVAAVHDRLAADGTFTAGDIAADVGCTAATFWAHFGTKDDAITAAFVTALDDLVVLAEHLFDRRPVTAEHVIDELITYFDRRALLYRSAIARFPEHRPLRVAYRGAEARTVDAVARSLGPDRTLDDAVAVVVFCQGINNPTLLRSAPGGRTRRRLADALATLLGDG
ncbi:MAG: hypothetical protein AAGF02_10655 [Actinomycetota bacterium]